MSLGPDDDDDESQHFDNSVFALVADAVGFIVAVYEPDEDLIFLSEQWGLLTRGQAQSSYLSPHEFRLQLHPDDATRMSMALQECLQGDLPDWHAVLRARSVSGPWCRLLMQARITERSQFGEPRRIVAAMFDISRQIQLLSPDADDGLYQPSFEHNLVGMLIGTPEGVILHANAAACQLSGYSQAELRHLGRDGLIDRSDHRLDAFLKQRRYLGQLRANLSLMRKDGQRIEVELSSVLFTDAQGLLRNVITLQPAGAVALAERELQQARRLLQARKQCGLAIVRAQHRAALLQGVCQALAESLGLPLAWVGGVDGRTLNVLPLQRHGKESAFLDLAWYSADARVEEGGGPVGRALRSGQPQACADLLREAEAEAWRAAASRHRVRAMAALPLGRDESQPLVLVLLAREAGFFDAQLMELLGGLAQEIAFGLEKLERDNTLLESELRFRALWEATLDAIAILDADATVHYANPALARIFGHRIEEVMGRSFCMLFPEGDKLANEKTLKRYLARQRARSWRAVGGFGRRKDGSSFPVEVSFSVATVDGQRRFVAQARDISRRYQAEQLSRQQNAILRRIASGASLPSTLEAVAGLVEAELAGSSAAVALCNDGGDVHQVVSCALTPRQIEPLLTLSLGAAQPGSLPQMLARRQPLLLAARQEADTASLPLLTRAGEALYCWPLLGRQEQLLGLLWVERAEPGLPDAAQTRVLQVAADLAGLAIESRRAEERIRQLAWSDELTGLSNRAALTQALDRALARARRSERMLGMLLLDLDRFKDINQQLGQEGADLVLREVAARLQEAVRKDDVVARWGGDEFLVLMEQVKDGHSVARVAAKLQKAIAAPIQVGAQYCTVTASMGACLWPDDGADRAALLRHLSLAVIRARDKGPGSVHFHTAQPMALGQKSALEADLRQAAGEGQFLLHYQPRLDLRTGEVVAVEALLRWQHPVHGLLWPTRFLGLAEDSGLILDIGAQALHEACAQMRRWQDRVWAPQRMAVNLSAQQLASANLVSVVARAIQASGLPPGMLELELTQDALLQRQAEAACSELRQLGVRLAVEDFGAGIASLAQLRQAGADVVTLDRSMVRELGAEGQGSALAQAIVAAAHALRQRVAAKGVETVGQLDRLQAISCDEIQGYHFCRPLPAAELGAFLQQRAESEGAAPQAQARIAP